MTPRPVRRLLEKLTGYAPACVESSGCKPGGGGVRALILSLVLVGATVAGVAGVAAGASSAGAPGMVAVPDSNIQADLPAGANVGLSVADLEGATSVSAHADTTEIILTTPSRASEYVGSRIGAGGGDLALVIRDSAAHKGRRVSLPADALKAALGYLPETVHGVHDSGETWTRPITAGGGRLSFRVPKFSSNTVTFSGTVSLSGNPATDGATYSYYLSNVDAVENGPTVNLTGVRTTEWDNVSAAGLSNGATFGVDVGGNLAPTGPASGQPRVTFTGVSSTPSESVTKTGLTGGESFNVPIDGNLAPTGPAGGEPQVTLTAQSRTYSFGNSWDSYSGTVTHDVTVDSPEPVTATLKASTDSNSDDVQAFVDGNSKGLHDVGSTYATWTVTLSPGTHTIKFESSAIIDTTIITWNHDVAPEDASVTFDTGQTVSMSGTLSDGQTKTVGVDLSTSTSSFDVSLASGKLDVDVQYTDRTATEDPSLTVDGETVSYSGVLMQGETVTRTLSTLSTGSHTADISLAGGSVGVDVALREQTRTVDPSVTLNGHTETYGSVLADGETATLTLNKSWVQEGTNTLEVSVGPSLSGDAPTPSVGLAYSHGAVDDVNISYTGEKWTERFTVTRSWGDAVEDATLSVSLSDAVVAIRDVQMRINGGSWDPLGTAEYNLSGTTLTAHLGDLPVNATTSVRVNASKVQVLHGEIDVLEPTVPGSDLQTRFQVAAVDDSGDLSLAVGGTNSGKWLHYLSNASWTNAEAYARVTENGQKLVLPNALPGARATARTLPLQVEPQSDVVVSVAEAGATPVLDVQPGDVLGDVVEYGWFNTVSGSEYALLSVTDDGTPRDKATASGGSVWLQDRNDDAETLRIEVLDSSTSSSGSSFETGGGSIPIVTDATGVRAPSVNPVFLLAAGAVVLLGGAFVVRRTRLRAAAVYPVIGLVGVVALETLRPGTVTGVVTAFGARLTKEAGTVAPALLLGGGGLLLWALYRLVRKFTSQPRIVLKR